MAKLYPPQIGGTVPAFYKNNLNKLTIPFTMNKTVAKTQVSGFNLIVKTVANSKLIGNLRVEKTSSDKLPPWNFTKGEVYFTVKDDDVLWSHLYIGQYYKVQLAYIDSDGIIGYYSSVGIMKFTTEPTVDIEGMEFATVNMNENVFVGTYSQDKLSSAELRDISEKVYSYCFNIYDAAGNLFETSGELLHNSFEDENAYSSRDIYTLKQDLIVNKNYYIQYVVTTTNNAIFKSNKYRIMQKETIDPEIKATIKVDLNEENGYVNVRLIGQKDDNGIEYAASGSFVLKRGCNKDNYATWDSILSFRLNGNQPSRWLWRDMTVEHGYTYKYALQQFNDEGLYSNKLYSNEVYISFEDCFLFDGKKQLKLKYNPKITSFKDIVLETKTNTIGSKYPFIFRNGNVQYKEFPISGLISYLSDEEELFLTQDELFLETKTTDLVDNNIAAERIFKMKVLEWFNNGQPKIFRSPGEGNYIVRLTNASMTPTDGVGRMLHTISATASEVADFTYDALLEYKFLELINTTLHTTRWETVQMVDVDDFGNARIRSVGEELLNYSPATSLTFENIVPGTQFKLTNNLNEEDYITIGTTGVYNIDLMGLTFTSVKTNSANIDQGSLIYSYESNLSNVFDTIADVTINDYPLIQFMGEHNIIKEIENTITQVLDFTYLRFNKRAVYDIFTKNNKFYWDAKCTSELLLSNLETGYIYKVIEMPSENYYYIDGQNPEESIKYSNCFYLDGTEIDLTETETYELIHPDKISSLTIGSGLSLECAYQTKTLVYSLEKTNEAVKLAKQNYTTALSNYLALLRWEKDDGIYYISATGYTPTYLTALENARLQLEIKDADGYTLYEKYIKVLTDAIEKQKEDNDFYD